jgi:TetR/AcrR family transcriptional regulator, transcriptional repressor for nem operon
LHLQVSREDASQKNISEMFLTTRQQASYILVGMQRRIAARAETARLHDPERTRQVLLQAAFREVYRSGFQSASLDTILAATGVTKGALYYHFGSKEVLGHAVVEEVIADITREKWLRPLQNSTDPIATLIAIVRGTSFRAEDIRYGCPLNNLAQEMSPLDKDFRKRLAKVFDDWQEGVASALMRGQAVGMVRRDLNAGQAASFLIATYEGYTSLAKNAQDANVLKLGVKNIIGWLRSLRTTNAASN